MKKAPNRKLLAFADSRNVAERLTAALQSRPSLRGAVSDALLFPAQGAMLGKQSRTGKFSNRRLKVGFGLQRSTAWFDFADEFA